MIDFFERLDKYMKVSGLNDNKITVEAGISNGLIGKARKRGSLSLENISKILHKYSDLDANWLLLGEGEMRKNHIKKEDLNVDFKELAETRKELLNYKDSEISNLKKEIDNLKKAQQQSYYSQRVADPKQKLK